MSKIGTKYKYFLSIKDRKYELLENEEIIDVSQVLERYLTIDEVPDYNEDPDEFIEEHVEFFGNCTELKVYLIDTEVTGWDTYDSAVYCAYTEDQAISMSIEDMGDSYCYNKAKLIGTAVNIDSPRQIVSSFNAG